MGFKLQFVNTVGRDQIPQERDQISVLFYAPAPKTTVNLQCFCKHFIKENKVTVTKADNKQMKKSTTESKDQQKLPVKG